MSRERLTVTAIIDTGNADVFGLEGLESQVVARAVRLLLQEMALPDTRVGHTVAVVSADYPGVLGDQAGTLACAIRVAEQNERDRAAVMVINHELRQQAPDIAALDALDATEAEPWTHLGEGDRVRVKAGRSAGSLAYDGLTGTIDAYVPEAKPRPWRVSLDQPGIGHAWFALNELEPLA